jgi:alkylation response protein AidB-like acyl-CoA dehydrogenase
VLLENVRIPEDALLGEVGQGHKIAFNILNVGRFTLGAGVLGEAKYALREAVAYARDRKQFGKPLTEFGLIKQKLARMAALIFVTESMVYRTGGLVSEALGAEYQDSSQVVAALEEYAIECSINKVFATEALAAVVDDMVQIFGGYGFIEDYPAARRYRDARISRIYEGTNEINRLVIPSMVLRRAQRGRLDLLSSARGVAAELLDSPSGDGTPAGPLEEERRWVNAARRSLLFAAGAAVQKHLANLEAHQQILGWIADLAIELFAAESAVLRAARLMSREEANGKPGRRHPGDEPAGHAGALQAAMVRLHLDDALPRMEAAARRILAATEEGDQLRTLLAGLRRLLKVPAMNTETLSRQVAQMLAGAGRYPG